VTTWSEVLDEMEQRLVDTEQVIGRKLMPIAPFVLPEGMGPIPEDQRERAVRIYAATRDAERRLTIALGQVGSELRAAQVGRPKPAYVDRMV